MAAAFMERRVRLRNSLLFILFIIAACNAPEKKTQLQGIPNVLVSRMDTGLSNANGTLLLHAQPFSGTIFTLHEGTTDTAELCSYLNGKEHGLWVKYYPPGTIKEKRSFDNGRKSGDYMAWWENGNKKLHYHFLNDEYEGECNEWNPSGTLVKIMNYKAGHEEGPQKWWYDNGKIKANYIIKNGRRFGLLGTKNCINVSDSIFKN